jgi:hypothetical protein
MRFVVPVRTIHARPNPKYFIRTSEARQVAADRLDRDTVVIDHQPRDNPLGPADPSPSRQLDRRHVPVHFIEQPEHHPSDRSDR